jgi:hypothetical protein
MQKCNKCTKVTVLPLFDAAYCVRSDYESSLPSLLPRVLR